MAFVCPLHNGRRCCRVESLIVRGKNQWRRDSGWQMVYGWQLMIQLLLAPSSIPPPLSRRKVNEKNGKATFKPIGIEGSRFWRDFWSSDYEMSQGMGWGQKDCYVSSPGGTSTPRPPLPLPLPSLSTLSLSIVHRGSFNALSPSLFLILLFCHPFLVWDIVYILSTWGYSITVRFSLTGYSTSHSASMLHSAESESRIIVVTG